MYIIGQLTFMDVIGQRVAKLLKEKEKVFTGSARAAHWLIEEAAEPEQIKKAGTMRYFKITLYLVFIPACLKRVEHLMLENKL